MPTFVVECPDCHFRFNYRVTRHRSRNPPDGKYSRLRCPKCRNREDFPLHFREYQNAYPTYDDMFTGREMALLMIPALPLALVSAVSDLGFSGSARLMGIAVPMIVLSAWLAGYFLHALLISTIRKVS